MRIEERNNKYLVVDDNNKILLITQSKNIAKNFLTKHSE
jgi:hypothetical protein